MKKTIADFYLWVLRLSENNTFWKQFFSLYSNGYVENFKSMQKRRKFQPYQLEI